MAPDQQLVSVCQPPPLDFLAVEDDAVEAAVVEHPDRLARFVDEERVAARDAWIVEADVGLGAAPDSGPAFLDAECSDRAIALVQSQIAARLRQRGSRLPQPI